MCVRVCILERKKVCACTKLWTRERDCACLCVRAYLLSMHVTIVYNHTWTKPLPPRCHSAVCPSWPTVLFLCRNPLLSAADLHHHRPGASHSGPVQRWSLPRTRPPGAGQRSARVHTYLPTFVLRSLLRLLHFSLRCQPLLGSPAQALSIQSRDVGVSAVDRAGAWLTCDKCHCCDPPLIDSRVRTWHFRWLGREGKLCFQVV